MSSSQYDRILLISLKGPVLLVALTTVQSLVRLNVRRLRLERGLTQEQLAADAGIARAYLGHIESRGKNISVDVLAALADALGTDPRELLRPQDEWASSGEDDGF